MPRRLSALLIAAMLVSCALHAQDEAVPFSPEQRGFHTLTLELVRHCADNGLPSEARRLCRVILDDADKGSPEADKAAELLKSIVADQADVYTAKAWGEYLDRLEALQSRRARSAFAALGASSRATALWLDPDCAEARKAAGQAWLDGIGWREHAEVERLKPLIVKTAEAPAKAPREATWQQPYVLVGAHFGLVTDLPWARAVKYAKLLDQFHAFFIEKLGDVIPARKRPNVVYCCKTAKGFAEFTGQAGFGMGETSAGLYVSMLGEVFINAERCDYVGKKNGARDNLARTLYHECAHRLVDVGLRGRNPDSSEVLRATEHSWIVESVAVTFEGLEIDGKKCKLTGLEFQRTYTIDKEFKATKKVPDLKAILRQGHFEFASEKPVNSAQKYAVAGSVGWYCLYARKDYRAAYLGLLVDYYRGDTTGRDFKARFGVSLDDFAKEWKTYVLK